MMNYEMKSADTSSNHCYEVHPQPVFPVEKSIVDPIKKKRKMKIKETDSLAAAEIKHFIENEEEAKKQIDKILMNIDPLEKTLLDHIGNFDEEPYSIIESYFGGQHLERLVRHQIESYNHFVNYQIQRTIQMFNPVTIHSENDYVAEKEKYFRVS